MTKSQLLEKHGIHSERIRRLDETGSSISDRIQGAKPDYILYWMQASQRITYNHALEYAALLANNHGLPLLVALVLLPSYPGANRRHYAFMLQGWMEIEKELHKRGAGVCIMMGEPLKHITQLSNNAAAVVCDCGYTGLQLGWRQLLAKQVTCPAYEVETNVIIPLEQVSQKEEYAARTIRPKINRQLTDYLVPLPKVKIKHKFSHTVGEKRKYLTATNALRKLEELPIDQSIRESSLYIGGQKQAQKILKTFLHQGLAEYDTDRNFPERDATSHLSPYLHFGQISPLDIALKVTEYGQGNGIDVEPFLEQLIVRRELAMNFCYYSEDCRSYACLPNWAVKTLQKHRKDNREHVYPFKDFANARTHDPFWNAAQNQLLQTGYMHNYMRMYWGKKVLEWSEAPEEAFETLHTLNDTYELDGRDPNGWTGIAWCFGKHDRPWPERAIYGTIRSMAASGLKKKFDIEKYATMWNHC